jgi:ribosomal protein S18 acetylase RimI-like enzyme
MSAGPRTFRERLRSRLRHGLATQEVLDRLARIGIVVYPYFLVEEPLIARPDVDALGEGLEVRLLAPEEAHLVAGVPERPRDEANVRELMTRADCVAVLEDGELLGYSWFRRDSISGPVTGRPLCQVPAGGAYLFDAYVRPKARGRKVVVYLRHRLHQLLRSQGIERCFSLSLAFNRSSRRFKHKLGAREPELRLLLRLGSRMTGVDLRLWRRDGSFATPALLLAPPRPGKRATAAH